MLFLFLFDQENLLNSIGAYLPVYILIKDIVEKCPHSLKIAWMRRAE